MGAVNAANAYPRVLIVGQSFSRTHGGGITLINLFKGWDPDKLAVITSGHYMEKLNIDSCRNYFSMGSDHNKKMFPLNLIQRKFSSGPVTLSDKESNPVHTYASKEKKLRNYFVMNVLYPFLHFTGLYHAASRFVVDRNLLAWIEEFKPDYLYSHLASLEMIRLVKELRQRLNRPLVVHIMDDWPSTIVSSGPFAWYWRSVFRRELKQLFSGADKRLAISEAMKVEYEKRYGGEWQWFNNPIETESWVKEQKGEWNIMGALKIGYTGRVGLVTLETLQVMARVVGELRSSGIDAEFHLLSPDHNTLDADRLKAKPGVFIHPPIPHSDMPKVLSSYDLLFLPLDFNAKALRFVKFSLPTKASEFMSSGVPIIVFASPETGLFTYAAKFRWARTVGECLARALKEAVVELANDEPKRRQLAETAITVARMNHDARIVRENFRKVFIN